MTGLEIFIIGFYFGLGFLLASCIFSLIGQVVTTLYTRYLVKKLKRSLTNNKPKDLHFGKPGKDGKII